MSSIRGPWDTWPVHGLCRSGHHEMCQAYEKQNFSANFVCGCTECDHPKPTREEYEALEIKIYGRVRYQEKTTNELDDDSPLDVASWFVEDDDIKDNDGHDEAQELEINMSTTEAVPAEAVEDEAVEATESVDSPESVESSESVDSPDADDTEDDDEAKPEPKKRARGELETEVKGVTDKYLAGKIKMPEDKELTPHYIALAIEKMYGYDEPPSTGAVAAVLKRWDQYGYATFGDDPFHFAGLTEAGADAGLDNLRTAFKEARKEERRKEREAKAAAAEASEDSESDDE